MQEYKNKIEAILFTTGRFMDVEEIARLCNLGSTGIVREALKDLISDYEKKDSALQIFSENDKYQLNIKKNYNHVTTKLLTDSELDRPTQETLAIIAYKQPIIQSDVIKVRGSGAYDHIKLLKEHEFIISEKYGRTRLLKLAPKFFDYFDVVQDKLMANFREIEDKVGTVEEVQERLPETKNQELQETAEEAMKKEDLPTRETQIESEEELSEEDSENPEGEEHEERN